MLQYIPTDKTHKNPIMISGLTNAGDDPSHKSGELKNINMGLLTV